MSSVASQGISIGPFGQFANALRRTLVSKRAVLRCKASPLVNLLLLCQNPDKQKSSVALQGISIGFS
eukprot:343944-Pelagomonas_calceolata.AAC.4